MIHRHLQIDRGRTRRAGGSLNQRNIFLRTFWRIQIDKARDFTMYRSALRNSPNFHVALNRVDGSTAWAMLYADHRVEGH